MPVINLVTGVPYKANSKHLPYELRWNPATYTPHYVPPTRKEKRQTINDNDRNEYVINVESLYRMQRSSCQSMREWIKENREMIDGMMKNSK